MICSIFKQDMGINGALQGTTRNTKTTDEQNNNEKSGYFLGVDFRYVVNIYMSSHFQECLRLIYLLLYPWRDPNEATVKKTAPLLTLFCYRRNKMGSPKR